MGDFAHVFHIRPWEWDQLAALDALHLMDVLDSKEG